MKQDWQIKKLGEVCEVIAGQSPEGKFYNTVGEGLPFYQGKKEYGEKYIRDPKTWTKKVTKEAFAGDILMSVRAPVGPVNFATQKICIGRGLASIRAGDLIDKEFLFYFLNNKENELEGNSGAVFNSINKDQIKQIPIPLPPLSEQKRIVAILDEAFEAIAKAKENTEQNLKNAKEIFESYLQGIFENKGEDWEEKKLGEVCEFINGLWKGKKEPFQKVGVIRNTNFSKDYKLDYSNVVYLDVESNQFAKRKLKYGDIILEKSGGGPKQPVGRVVVFDKITGDYSFSNFTSAIRIKDDSEIDFNYLYKYLMLKYISGETEKMQSHSTGIRNLKFDDYKEIPIPLPPLSEQQTIVRQLDALRAETQKLEAIYTQKLNSLDELKKSLLQKAFAGELVK